MKTIRISDEVWDAIASRGKFGETEEDVLRRVFKIEPLEESGQANGSVEKAPPHGWKERRTEVRMFQTVRDNNLILEFESGQRGEWVLPSKKDSTSIRRVRDLAVQFVRENGGTDGQVAAAMRALTSRGYHVTLKNERRIEYV